MPAPPAAALQTYRDELDRLARQPDAAHEGAVRGAFAALLKGAGGDRWTLVEEHTAKGAGGRAIRYDGVVRDDYGYTLGHWEAKDSGDDLEAEVQAKFARGYSRRNILFQAPARALLYQDGGLRFGADLDDPAQLAEVLDLFFRYREPEIERFHEAVAAFKARIPDLAAGLLAKIGAARREDPAFRARFEAFVETVRESVNPNVAVGAVEEMLVQHLLTERVIRSVFNHRDFARRNAIAREIEGVVDALTGRHFSREEFIGQLDRFYRAVEEAAAGIDDFAEKQDLLNTVYEQFFQGFSDRVADTHGIVYTPQPLVDFMVRSVDRLLDRHFGQSLAALGVHVLDPFVGTGNFLVRVMDAVPAPALPAKYGAGGARGELHANEVMLLPYYVASLNVEHAYLDKTGHYAPFEGIVLVDTFEMVEGKTLGMFSAENSERAQRQREAPITVVIGNPPYNAHQVNANDANQNRKYPHIDGRVSETYAAASAAQNKNALSDPYVKAFRWASDRVGDQGVVAFVTNDSFLDALSFDGMRRHLAGEFDEAWVVGLGGNVRKNPKLSGTTHNVFGIQVGVAVTLLVRTGGKRKAEDGRATIRYAEAGAGWRKGEKYDWLTEASDLDGLDWRVLEPNTRHLWLTGDLSDDWDDLIPLVSQNERRSDEANETTILDDYCPGLQTNRDMWIYGFDRERLAERVERFVDTYNAQVVKWQRKGGKGVRAQDVVTHDDTKIKWSSSLKNSLKRGTFADFNEDDIRHATYRPYVSKWLYFDRTLIHRPGLFDTFFPRPDAANLVIWLKVGSAWPMFALMVDRPADVLPQGGSQCIPLYLYLPLAEGGAEDPGETVVTLGGDLYARRENLTDWSLERFRARYAGETAPPDATPPDGATPPGAQGAGGAGREIQKADVFHYVYAVLHHPAYRARYAADLKRSLPRVPFAPPVAEGGAGFWPFAEAGRALAALHVGYEAAPEYPLDLVHAEGAPLTDRVERMKLDEGAGTLRLNGALTLAGIPPEAFAYRLGNRSALGWLADQVRVKTDKRSGIVHDPNTAGSSLGGGAAAGPGGAVAALVRRVTWVSVETVRIVAGLPELGLPDEEGGVGGTGEAT